MYTQTKSRTEKKGTLIRRQSKQLGGTKNGKTESNKAEKIGIKVSDGETKHEGKQTTATAAAAAAVSADLQ